MAFSSLYPRFRQKPTHISKMHKLFLLKHKRLTAAWLQLFVCKLPAIAYSLETERFFLPWGLGEPNMVLSFMLAALVFGIPAVCSRLVFILELFLVCRQKIGMGVVNAEKERCSLIH